MSLQVWMPLNGDLHNQGLDNSGIFIISPTYGIGKIGAKAMHCDVGVSLITFNNLIGVSEFSIAYWLYIDSSVTNFSNYADFWEVQMTSGNTTSIARDEFRTTNTTDIGMHAVHMVKDATVGSNANTYYSFGNRSTAKDKWCHIVLTKNADYCDIYENGIRYGHLACSNIESSPCTLTGKVALGNSGCKGAYLNDFRIYDHCLSSMEVKELAKGLVLHYPLNRQGWGQENLVVNTGVMATISNVCNYRIDSGCSVTNGIGRLSGDGGWRAIGVHNGLKLADYQNKTVTISVDIKAETTGATYRPIIEFRTNNTAFGTTRTWRYRTINLTATDGTTIPTTEWKRFTCTVILQTGFFTAYDNADMNVEPDWTNGYWGIHCYNHSSIYYNIKNIKLELGSIATPWCPNSSDALATTIGLNSTTEYDCSGFCNNGTRTGTFTWTSDTPKYAVSQVFNGTDNAIQTPNLTTMITDKNYTIACWTYKTVIGTKNYQTIYGGPSGFELEARSSSSTSPLYRIHNWGGGTTAYNFGEWTHFCFVHTDSDSKLYVNGELKITGTSVNVPSGNYFVGAWNTSTSQNYEGNMSDFRIYATALSANDVKSLYQNSAYIDSSGNVYGAVHMEV